MKANFIVLGIFLLLISCEKNEIPVTPHDSGDNISAQVQMGADYKWQIFYSLKKNQVISQNLKTDWDLAFESASNGFHLRLNTSKGMTVSKSSQLFGEVTDTIDAIWLYDVQSGHQDSTAFGDWIYHDYTYLINRGYDESGNHLGFKKIKLLNVNENSYTFLFGDLLDIEGTELSIQKSATCHLTYFSFATQTTLSIAPPDNEWDLLFTQYTHIFEDNTPYLVTGVLLNPYNTKALRTENINFEEIDYAFANSQNYTDCLNTIGYDWKTFDYSSALYEVNSSIIFVIQNQSGIFYKLRFTGFYNDTGIKGSPSFEYCAL